MLTLLLIVGWPFAGSGTSVSSLPRKKILAGQMLAASARVLTGWFLFM